MKISKGKRTEKNLIISAIAMLLISTLLFGLGSEQGINFIKNLKNALNPISSIDVSSKSNEILKNQITNAKIVIAPKNLSLFGSKSFCSLDC